MTTDLVDPVHAVEIIVKDTERKDLEASPLYGFPLGHWDNARRIEEV